MQRHENPPHLDLQGFHPTGSLEEGEEGQNQREGKKERNKGG